jgi:hypothetical protein
MPARQCVCKTCRNHFAPSAFFRQGDRPMLIFMLAAAMTVAMLIATAFALRAETERVRVEDRRQRLRNYGPY